MGYMVMEWIYYILCMVCMVLVGEWTYHWTVRDWKKFVLAGVIYAAGFVYCIVLGHQGIKLFFFFEIFAWVLICHGRWIERTIKVIIISYVVGFVEGIMAFVAATVLNGQIEQESVRLLQIVLTLVMWGILVKQRWYQYVVMYMESASKLRKILIVGVIMLGVEIASFGMSLQILSEYSGATSLFSILITLELCLITGIVISLVVEGQQKKYYVEQNQLKEEYIRTQQDYYKMIYEKDKEMRSFRHDVANQIGLLQMLIEQGKMEEAKQQLIGISHDFYRATLQKVQTGNEMLDAILSMMNQKAVEKGVKLEISGELQNESRHNVYELCTIFTNAINNAIEACCKLDKEKKVQVKLVEHNQSLCCIFENPASEIMYQAVMEGKTTKEDEENHGHGVKNIQQAVERLGGEMEYRYENGKIRLEIMI